MSRDVHFSIEHAREELGYQPKDSWRAALRITVQHYAAVAARRAGA
jgi:nucleoside-diphosphate-sugar epimerase